MYTGHFNLKKKPFQISSDPGFLWLGPKHAKALDILQAGIKKKGGILVFTGDVGTGKTTLLNELVCLLDDDTLLARISNPCLEMHQVFTSLAQAFGFQEEYSRGQPFVESFSLFLEKAWEQSKKLVLMVDEGQRIPKRLFQALFAWSALGPPGVLTVILAGQTECRQLLTGCLSREEQELITKQAFLFSLDPEETGIYVKKRLELAGAEGEIFLKSALAELYSHTLGCPRLINIVCDHALITAYAGNLKKVDSLTLASAVSDLDLPGASTHGATAAPKAEPGEQAAVPSVEKRTGWRPRAVGALSAACLALFLVYFGWREYGTSVSENVPDLSRMEVYPLPSPPLPVSSSLALPSGKVDYPHAYHPPPGFEIPWESEAKSLSLTPPPNPSPSPSGPEQRKVSEQVADLRSSYQSVLPDAQLSAETQESSAQAPSQISPQTSAPELPPEPVVEIPVVEIPVVADLPASVSTPGAEPETVFKPESLFEKDREGRDNNKDLAAFVMDVFKEPAKEAVFGEGNDSGNVDGEKDVLPRREEPSPGKTQVSGETMLPDGVDGDPESDAVILWLLQKRKLGGN